jgi:murein DD-endopeptidase MepM/ murein hydrolase activator NlpD
MAETKTVGQRQGSLSRRSFPVAGLIMASAAAAQPAEPELAKPRVVGIDWPDTGAISVSSGARDRLEGADKTLLPVLIPRPFLTYKSLKFVGEPLQYSASVQAQGATLAITGTRIAVDAEADPEPSASEGVRTLLGEKSAEANTTRYGAAYSVTVECVSGSDSRCNKEDYVTNLLRSVEIVGGSRETAPPPPPPTPPPPSTIPVSSDPNFAFKPAGELLPGSGEGVRAATIYAPGIRFPVSTKPVFLNSQVWNVGGTNGPPGGWSDPRNYRYPWRDNFCEKRHWRTPMCPGGTGHQGVDIRPAKAKNPDKQMAVAVESGRIAKIGSYSLTLAGDSGTQYNYLHLRNLKVSVGQRVTAGQAIGVISNNFGSTSTTYHLHFEIKQNRNGRGWVHVPPYSSLVAAYERL